METEMEKGAEIEKKGAETEKGTEIEKGTETEMIMKQTMVLVVHLAHQEGKTWTVRTRNWLQRCWRTFWRLRTVRTQKRKDS